MKLRTSAETNLLWISSVLKCSATQVSVWLPQIPLYRDRPFIRLVDQLLYDLDRNRASGLVFIDYKKAFDLIDHGLLLEKLKAYGVRDNELDLLRSYLSGRTQYVHINGCHSSLELCCPEYRKGAFWAPFCFSCSLTICHRQHSILP